MKTVRALLVLLLAIVLLTSFSAASTPAAQAQQPDQPKRGGTLTIARRASPNGMNFLIDPTQNGLGGLNQMHEGLFGVQLDGVYGPRLAEGAPEHPDALTYIFHLKQGVKFATGEELTADDVKFSYERLMDPKNNASFGGPYRDNIDKIEVLDKYTVKFTLKRSWPVFVSMTGSTDTWIINKKTADNPDFGTKWWNGTGAFVLTEYVQGDHFTLVRNPNYREQPYPYLDKIIYKVIPDEATQLANLETGQLDVIQEPLYSDLERLSKDPRFKVVTRDSNSETIMQLNTARPPFNDKRVRQAISLAVDRQELVDSVFYGYADVAGDPFPPKHWAHDASLKYEYNPEKAKQLLAEAGYGPNKPLTFKLGTYRISQYQDQAVLIQSQLAKIGVKAEVMPMENVALLGILRSPRKDWTVDAGINGLTPLRGTAYEFAYYTHGKNGSVNYTGYNADDGFKNPDVEEWLLQATQLSDYIEADREKAKPIYSKISQAVMDDVPMLRLNWWKKANITQKWVMDYPMAEADINLLYKTWINK
jgi:peptide/nickel transport system substrate-binding protein